MTQRIFGNIDNVLRTGSVTATSFLPSNAYTRQSATRVGGGQVSLSGDFTGDQDAVFEIEIRNDTIVGDPLISEPLFVGVGNGTISDITAASGKSARTITVTLVDLGTSTTSAYANFGPVILQAASAGEDGNDITLAIDRSGLTFTETSFSVPEDMSKSENAFRGQEYNFGGKVLLSTGEIPDDAPRIKFENQPYIYRQYRKFVDGEYEYSFSPALKQNVRAGTKVYSVSGTYSATVTDGVSPESYPSAGTIESLYDLLSAIESGSSLLEVVGVVSADRLPGGLDAVDINLFTTPYIREFATDGGQYLGDLTGVTLDSDAKTEKLTITCKDDSVVGSEEWEVEGPVTGLVTTRAITNVAYTAAPVNFTIPQKLPPTTAPNGSIQVVLNPASRGSGETPVICDEYVNAQLGARARSGTYRFTYSRRPSFADCSEIGGNVTGGTPDWINCLGIEPPGGTDTVATLDAALKTRAQTLFTWRQEFIEGNTSLLAGSTAGTDSVSPGPTLDGQIPTEVANHGTEYTNEVILYEEVSAVLKVDRVDIKAANAATALYWEALQDIFQQAGEITTAVGNEFDSQLTDLDTDFSVLDANDSASYWRDASKKLAGSDHGIIDLTPQLTARLLTEEFNMYLERYRAQIDSLYLIADLTPPFDTAGSLGTECWRDLDEEYYWVSQDGLLQAFTNVGYHSARRRIGENGEEIIESTQEFFFVPAIAGTLQPGDQIAVIIENASGVSNTYKEGDRFSIDVVAAGPVEFGGGQDGDDTLTFSVRDSVDGALAAYSYDTTSPAAYSDSGIGFEVTPGTIPFALGDQFSFAVEGGQFRWRKDGGSWSADTQIDASVSLSDGVSAVFDFGQAPSFVADDVYEWLAESVNGPQQTIRPTDTAMEWTTSTVITVNNPGTVTDFFMVHELASGATVQIEGSDDSFSTSPLDTMVTVTSETMSASLGATNYAEYRITITGSGSIKWLWLGSPYNPVGAENGRGAGGIVEGLTRRLVRQASGVNGTGAYIGKGRSGRVSWSWLSDTDADNLEALIVHAFESDQARIGFLPHHLHRDEGFLARVEAPEISDKRNYQSDSASRRNLSATLALEGIV